MDCSCRIGLWLVSKYSKAAQRPGYSSAAPPLSPTLRLPLRNLPHKQGTMSKYCVLVEGLSSVTRSADIK